MNKLTGEMYIEIKLFKFCERKREREGGERIMHELTNQRYPLFLPYQGTGLLLSADIEQPTLCLFGIGAFLQPIESNRAVSVGTVKGVV